MTQCKTSYLLQDWEQRLTVEVPFATVSATLDRILGFPRSVYTLERHQQDMAEYSGRIRTPIPIQTGHQSDVKADSIPS
ncbi:hypothetical protein G3480_26200 [Thiorhodococcus mannitoliphagus]|uniref:Uncharacterized protein n=1 Tax=Thiorhodococcus mannitoliphagus TaxID=329406 RepID=A0A6P1DZH8_9GAMM|nr:hypothetical protein [Thiorhodococcus mannitoliphagus]NEX23717.1 hypothetical protein [Thiorhodococcus mannitoliphagus]